MNAPNERPAQFGRVTAWCASLVIIGGLLTLAGWGFGMAWLASLRDIYIPMAPSSALCFCFIGAALLLVRFSRLGAAKVLALLVLLVAAAKTIELLLHAHFGLDEWLVQNPAAFGSVQTGRMSPISAAMFLLIALGTFSAASSSGRKTAGPLATLAGLISGVVLLGYWYGTPLLYGGTIIPVALTTALAMLLSAIALLGAAGPEAWPVRLFRENSTRALLMRSFLPAIVLITLLNGWIRATFVSQKSLNPAVSSALAAIFFALLVTWIIVKVSAAVGARIDRAEEDRNRAQEDLKGLNAHLEQLVRARTAELQEKNAQMKADLEMAREMQLALLPQKFPSIPAGVDASDSAVRFLSYYFPTGDVSGDFFSVFPVSEQAVGIFICDVMGHDVRAALVTSMIRALIEERGPDVLQPGELLTRINDGLAAILKQSDMVMYATGCYLVVDLGCSELRYATAGHPRPLLIRRETLQADPLLDEGISGPALGIFPETKYGMGRCPLAKGDRIMMFTDGLFEVESSAGEMFNEQLLLDSVRRHVALASGEFFEEVLKEVRAFSAHQAFDDDVCLVGVEVAKH